MSEQMSLLIRNYRKESRIWSNSQIHQHYRNVYQWELHRAVVLTLPSAVTVNSAPHVVLIPTTTLFVSLLCSCNFLLLWLVMCRISGVRPLWKGCSVPTGLATHRLRTTDLNFSEFRTFPSVTLTDALHLSVWFFWGGGNKSSKDGDVCTF